MKNQLKVDLLQSRAKLLESRGPHNAKIVRKIKRKIRKFEGEG